MYTLLVAKPKASMSTNYVYSQKKVQNIVTDITSGLKLDTVNLQ